MPLIACNSTNKKPICYPPMGGRNYFLLENRSPASVYMNEGSVATSETGVEIVAGGFYELEHGSVPQGEIHISGTITTDQLINITER